MVICTFTVSWAPFVVDGSAANVLQRLVPVQRGLYEDYVANFWCVTSPVFKWRLLYSKQVWLHHNHVLCLGDEEV